MKRPSSRAVDVGINGALLSAVAVVLALPGSPLRRTVGDWLDERRTASLIEAHWDDLLSREHEPSTLKSTNVVVAFVDYQCTACATAHTDMKNARAGGGDLVVVHRHLPLTRIHPNAEGAARTAICAGDQGMLSEATDILYSRTDWHDSADWLGVAKQAGIADLSAFELCMASDDVRERLREDRRWAELLGVTATPTFIFHDGKEVGYVRGGRLAGLLVQHRGGDET